MKKIISVLSLLLAFTTAVFAQTEKPPQSYLDAMEAMRNSDYKAAVASFRPKILYQEKARYTEVARLNAVQGTVMLSVVFDASSQITNIRVVRGLPDGLTQCAIHAAQKIRFQPATKDGAPVSVRGTLESSFNLY